MSTVLLKILNMSIAASWLIAVVILVRLFLKKAPKWISCVLWALVALRLLIPFSFESSLSLLPSGETISYKTVALDAPADDPAANAADPSQTPSGGRASQSRILVVDTGIPALDDTLNPALERSQRNRQTAPVENPVLQNETAVAAKPTRLSAETWTLIAVVVWITGLIGLLVYALITYLKLRIKTSASIRLRGNIWASDELKTPFILGIVKPVIYVPSSLGGDELEYVLAHEEAHLRRRDHWWKPLGFLLLAIYWFNPLCWLAYILLCRDIEAACDEKAIQEMNRDEVASYSQTLLNLSFQRKQIAACPLAFGEVGVKQRIKSILNYKKPAFWVILLALVACIVVAVCFLTSPKKKNEPENAGVETTEPVKEPTEEPTKEPAKASEEPSTESSDDPGENTPAEPKVVVLETPQVIFNLPVNQGEDSLTGRVEGPQDPTPDYVSTTPALYEFGPQEYALRSEDEIIVLDHAYRALRFRKGMKTEILVPDRAELGDLWEQLLLHEDDVYLAGSKGVLRWNLETGECTFFTGDFPRGSEKWWIYDLVWDDGLVLCNERGANKKLLEETGEFVDTEDGYRSGLSGDNKTAVIQMNGKEWRTADWGDGMQFVAPGPGNSFFAAVTIGREENGKYYDDHFLRQYGSENPEGRLVDPWISIQYPGRDTVWYYPFQGAYVGMDGVYALLVEKDVAKVVKYIDFDYGEEKPAESAGESKFIQGLRETDPEIFEVDTMNGLIVAVAKFAENDYKCTLISGGRPWVLFTEVAGRDYTSYSPEEMMEILETYSLKDSEILVRYYQHPLSSWMLFMGEEKQVLQKISAQFNDRFGTGILSVIDDVSEYETKAPDSVRLDLTFDQVLSKGEVLNPNVLDSFKEYLSEGKDEGEVLPWGFLCQTYKDPSEIDLGLLFYSKGTESEVSQEEGQAAWTQAGWTDSMWAEPKKVTIQGVKEVIAVTEAQLQAFRSWIYVPEYDAYYSFTTDMPDNIRTDTLLRGCTLERAAIEELGIPVNADAVTAIEWSAPERPGAEAMTGMILFSTEGSEPTVLANILLK